jgi:hypothetical protein
MQMNSFGMQAFPTSIMFLFVLAMAVLHLVFAVGVFQAARRGQEDGSRCWLVQPRCWALGCWPSDHFSLRFMGPCIILPLAVLTKQS